MNREELDEKLNEIKSVYERSRESAIHEYCFANNTVKVGDVFTDHIGSILVGKIQASTGWGVFQCKYYGAELTKKHALKKSGAARFAFQNNSVDAKCRKITV